MKKLILFVVLMVAAFTAPTLADTDQAHAGPGWPGGPLLNCPDLDGGGSVNFPDFLILLQRFGGSYNADPDTYSLLADLNGDKGVGFPDFLVLLQQFSNTCPLMESQVALATLAAEKYRDPAQATADGYSQGSQYVANMGIHVSKFANFFGFPDIDPANCTPGAISGTCQLEHPAGLLYTETSPGSGVADELIGLWFIVPVQPVCDSFFLQEPDPCDQPVGTHPIGFGLTNTDEDSEDPDGGGPQRGWHTHPSLCVWNINTTQAFTAEGIPEGTCADLGGLTIWFETFGWMNHLYSFIPNPAGRFQNWSCLIPGGVVPPC